MNTHETKDGQVILIEDMTDTHLLNTIRMLMQMSRDGVSIRHGGGFESDEMWYDEYVVYGKEALDELNFAVYADEAHKRKLKFMAAECAG